MKLLSVLALIEVPDDWSDMESIGEAISDDLATDKTRVAAIEVTEAPGEGCACPCTGELLAKLRRAYNASIRVSADTTGRAQPDPEDLDG